MLRLTKGRSFDKSVYTNEWVYPDQFIEGKVNALWKLPVTDEVERVLDEVNNIVLNEYEKLINNGDTPTKEWLSSIIDIYYGQNGTDFLKEKKPYFTDFLDWYIENDAPKKLNSKGQPISKRTIGKYKQTLSKLKLFEKSKKKKYKTEEYDLKWYRNFISYLRMELNQNNGNTIGSYIKDVKTNLRIAHFDYSYKISIDIDNKKFKTIKSTSIDPYLTIEQIQIIWDKEIDPIKHQAICNARKLLIISCWTGMRGSDFCSYDWSKPKWKTDKVGKIFKYTAKKTKKIISVPIFPMVKEVLKEPPYPISTQKFNIHVKDLLEITEMTTPTLGSKIISVDKIKRKVEDIYPFNELCSSHIGRRSFASNLDNHTIKYKGKEMKLSRSQIMTLTGHSKESDFLTYIKKTQDETAENIMDSIDRLYN
jgi:integrase